MIMPQLFQAACRAGVLLNPGSIYDQQSAQYIRLSYAYAGREEIHRGLEILAGLLERR